MDEILVSVSCITYNQEKYIVDAIESFLMQKTNFKFEILIHDDASTDGTKGIIKEYEEKYTNLIKPIYQIENQYSQGIKIHQLNVKRARGKYIAICEGDDFWTDPYKLQKQVDYMESHPECSICVHSALRVSTDKQNLEVHVQPSKRNKIFKVEEAIEGGGGLFATNTILYPSKFCNFPDFYKNAPVGDYPLVIYLAICGDLHYINEFMSAYRVEVEGSWTNREVSNSKGRIEHFDKISVMLDEINKFTEYKYDIIINKTKQNNQFKQILSQSSFKEIKSGKWERIYSELSLRNKIYVLIFYFSPKTLRILSNLKGKIKL